MKTPHKLPQTFERYVEPVYNTRTGKLESYRVSVDFTPDRIRGIKAGRKVVVTISKWERPK